jgi:hypothetical protein
MAARISRLEEALRELDAFLADLDMDPLASICAARSVVRAELSLSTPLTYPRTSSNL